MYQNTKLTPFEHYVPGTSLNILLSINFLRAITCLHNTEKKLRQINLLKVT